MRIRQLRALAFLCAWACTGAAVWAQPVTLADVQRAAANNIDVSLARRALAAARGDVLAADHVPVPQLTAKASQMDLQHGLGPGNVWDKRIDKSLGVDWTLERGGKREARTAAARAGAEAARADVREAVVQQQLAASNAFFDLLAAQEKLAQVEGIAASGQQLAQAAQRRVRAGDLSRQDASRVQIEAERADADVRSAQAERERARLALAQATGLAANVSAAGDWPDAPAPAGIATEADVERRADVIAARERVNAAQRALDGALALRKTDVTVGASYDHFPGTSTRLVELRVQVPLPGAIGYAYGGEIARAQAQLAQAEDQLEKTRRLAIVESRRLEQDLVAAAARAASYRERIVPQAQEAAQMAEFAYARGATSLIEVIDARRTLRAVLLEALAARAEHARAFTASQLRRREVPDTENP